MSIIDLSAGMERKAFDARRIACWDHDSGVDIRMIISTDSHFDQIRGYRKDRSLLLFDRKLFVKHARPQITGMVRR